MNKILVTGGLGFIGSNLVDNLLSAGHEVTIVDDLSSCRPDYQDLLDGWELQGFIKGCFSCDQVLLDIKNKKFDTVFHVAAIPRVSYSVEEPFKTTDVNINRTVKLIESCVGSVGKFVFSSSSSVYGGADELPTPNTHPKDPKSPYAWQKSCIEDFLKITSALHDFNCVSLRYFNVFGPGQFGGSAYSTAISAWCHAVKNNTPLRKDGSGEQSRDMCYIDNVVQANINSMNSDKKFQGDCYNVACGDRTSNNQILEFFKEKFKTLNIVNAPFRQGDVMHTQADISKTYEHLQYDPKVKFWEGLNKTLEWWKL